jgi:hypothetical protein
MFYNNGEANKGLVTREKIRAADDRAKVNQTTRSHTKNALTLPEENNRARWQSNLNTTFQREKASRI